jgi:hypothetical protein
MLSQPLRAVVRWSDGIPLGVRELKLNYVRVHSLFIQQRAGHRPKTMCGHCVAWIPVRRSAPFNVFSLIGRPPPPMAGDTYR